MLKLTCLDLDYLSEELGINMGSHPADYAACLKAMEKYPFAWWRKYRNGDSRVLAAWQIDEPVLLISKDTFLKGVSKVMGRTVKEDELHSWNTSLIAEFHEKYDELMAQQA